MSRAYADRTIAAAACLLVTGALVGGSSWLMLVSSRATGGITTIWIASGVLVGLLLTSKHGAWSASIAGAFFGTLTAFVAWGDPPVAAVVQACASTLEACLVACVLRYWVGDVADPLNLRVVAQVAPWSTLAACLLSALIVTGAALARGTPDIGAIFAQWFASHILGIVVTATTVVVVRHRGLRPFVARLGWNFALSISLVAATTLLVFSQPRYPLLFLVYPALILATFRHRFDGAVIAIVVVVAGAVVATGLGHGPSSLIADATNPERVAMLQCFIATTCLSTLPIVIVLSQLFRLKSALAASEGRLRSITDNLPALVSHVDTQQRYTFANVARAASLGLTPAAMVGHTLQEVLDEQTCAAIRPHVEAALTGKRVTFDGEADSGGEHLQYQTDLIPDCAGDGSVQGFYAMTFDISERVRAQRELQRIAQHDSLTGLGNRDRFNTRLEHALATFRRDGRPPGLIYLDIDHFKSINDTHGHAVGDAVLCEFANRLQANLRKTDLAARLGGDEFAAIIDNVDRPEILDLIARKLIAVMHPEMAVGDARMKITTSIGVAVCSWEMTAETLMLAADNALYEAKAAGRNVYRTAGRITAPRALELADG